MLEIELNTFQNNLLKTQAYCQALITNLVTNNDILKIASVFRSFNPRIQESKLFKFRKHIYDFDIEGDVNTITQAHWAIDPIDSVIVDRLFRDQLAHKESWLASQPPFNEKYQGDIVISSIDETVLDGASEVQSFGLFDVHDIPPVDTWFYLTHADTGKRLLFAWIPQAYMHYANNAIEVNCVDCIGWFKDWYPDEYNTIIYMRNKSIY